MLHESPDNPKSLLMRLGASILVVFGALRGVLLAEHWRLILKGPLDVANALAMGTVFDLVVTAWLLLPVALYFALVPRRWYARRSERWLRFLLAFAATVWFLFSVSAEWFFFQEFDSRFNFVAVDYLVFPTEVVTNIWESYPTGWILATLAAVGVVVVWRSRRMIELRSPGCGRARWGPVVALTASGLLGSWWISPARGEVSQDRVVNEIARNGFHTFCAALRGSHGSFDGLYASMPEAEVFATLHQVLAEKAAVRGSFAATSTERMIVHPGPERRLNVVVVLEESLGSDFVGALGRGKDASLTPSLDALAAQGTLLTNAYSTGNRTIRAIEATTSGLPPLPGVSIVRRPQSEGLFTLPALLRERGYDTSFIYGGRALFDGMGGYLGRNGVDRIIDQASFPDETFRTAWGVADQAIFDRALEELDRLDAQERPFYSLVLSVSNHRPFTFPENAEIRRRPELGGRENAVRYADWALGRFMAAARSKPWFGETVFVLMGDHGARVYGSAELPLASYQVPILFIGPGIEAGRRLDTLASSLDVPPTILGLLQASYRSKFFGRDVFAERPDEGRALMTHNSKIGLLEGHHLAVLGLQGATSLYECDLDRPECRPASDDHAFGLIEQAIAFYNGANLLYERGGYRMVATSLSPPSNVPRG